MGSVRVDEMTADTREHGVILREVTAENVRSLCELKLADGQERYVAPARYTVAEAAYDRIPGCARSTTASRWLGCWTSPAATVTDRVRGWFDYLSTATISAKA
jgi:hypothetical protein